MNSIRYDKFIQNIVSVRGLKGIQNDYFERHHILPRCCGGTDDPSNIIDLFPEEHYNAHKILAEDNPDILGLQQAFACMSFMQKDRYKVTAEQFGAARRAQAKASSARLKGVVPGLRKGIPHSEKTKQLLREINKNYHPTDEARRKQSEAQRGRIVSTETRQKLSEARKGIKHPPEFGENISRKLKGNQNALGHTLSQECKNQIQQTKKLNGTDKWSEAHHEKIRQKQLAGELHWSLSEESKKHISEGRQGIEFSTAHRKHLSEAQRGKSRPNSGKYKRTSTTHWKRHIGRLLRGTYFSDPQSPHRGEFIETHQLEYVLQCLKDKNECSVELVPSYFIDSITSIFNRLGAPDMEEAQELVEEAT